MASVAPLARLAVATGAAAIVAAAAGCGSSTSAPTGSESSTSSSAAPQSSSAESSSATSSAAPATAAPSMSTVAVKIMNFAFMPQKVTVATGTTVVWTNEDSAVHTTTADKGAWDSKNLAQGQSFSFTFTTPGTYTYHCAIHNYMTGTVVVTG